MILYPLDLDFSKEDIIQKKALWGKISKELDSIPEEEVGIDSLLQRLGISEDEYITAIRASISNPTVFLKRSVKEVRINSYNANVLRAWRANLDVQFILDVYACATYVASYITKSQRGMSELLRKATEEARQGNQTIKQQIKAVGNKFLNAVEISAQEAVYICLQLPMKKSSRQVVFLNTSPPEERVTLLKPTSVLDNMKDDDEDVECSNIFTRYKDRPSSMGNVILAEFAAYYDTQPSRSINRNKSKRNAHQACLPEPNIIENDDNADLDDDSIGPYKRRKKSRIIRSVHFNIDTDSEKHYGELLMLYHPWRDEQELKGNSSSYYDQYRKCQVEIEEKRKEYELYSETVDEAQRLLDESNELEYIWDEIAPHTESENAEDMANSSAQPDKGIENYDIGIYLGLPPSNAEEEINKQYELPDIEFRQHMRRLNKEHMEFVYDTIHILKTDSQPIYRFLSGGAGVGKSYVTNALYQLALKFFNK